MLALFFVVFYFSLSIGVFLFAEYKSYKRGQDCWFWQGKIGQLVVKQLKLNGKSRFSSKIFN
jgi:hypothetical protein